MSKKKHHVLLIIDNREGNVSKRNKDKVDLVSLWKQGSDYTYSIAIYPLEVGDVWICDSEEPIPVPSKYMLNGNCAPFEEGRHIFPPSTPNVVVERKALADLQSSYSDGRYKEQKARLTNLPEATRVVMVIEGYDGRLQKDATKKKRLLSTFTNTQFRDNIGIYHTACLEDSHDWIHHLCSQMSGGKLEHAKEDHHKRAKWTDTVKMNKKANLTPDKGLEMQLATIPGLSAEIGRAIGKEYKTMTILCKAFEEQGGKILSDIKVHGKRLGDKRSQRIFEYVS